MKIQNKNLWAVFHLLTSLFFLFLVAVSYLGWNKTYGQYQTAQENLLKLIANSTHSLYKTNEVMLDIVGHRFIEDIDYKDNLSAMGILDAALVKTPAITAIAIINPKGDMLFATNGLDVSKFPNLIEQKESRASFLSILNSDEMMFGRTYFFKPFQDWIVPIRKAIRDKEGKVKLVISAALRLEDSFGFIIESIDDKHQYLTSIIRDEDMFIQYTTNERNNNDVNYNSPISLSLMNALEQNISKNTRSIEGFKGSDNIVSFNYQNEEGVNYLASFKYDVTYKLWLSSMIQIDTIQNEFLKLLITYLIIFACGECVLFILFNLLATADKKRNDDLMHQATHDQLTGLLNLSYLQSNDHNWIAKNAPPFSLLYIDLDNFKNINDNFGRQCGDDLLIELTNRLQSTINKDSVLFRYGGDEFVLLTSLIESDKLLELAKTIINTVSKPYHINELRLHIGACVGITKYPEHGDSLDLLLRSSDIAMYESKKTKNCVHIFQNSMEEGYLKNVQIEQALRHAIENNELHMVYQAQFNSDGSLYGVEALVRWKSATLGVVPPDIFISVAEASGLMSSIGQFIIDKTLADIKAIQNKLHASFQTSINISVRQLLEENFSSHFIDAIKNSGLQEASITMEITESLFIEDKHNILSLLYELKSHGIKLSLDDFGTGYSSLSMLRELPIDELKIDKSFVDEMSKDPTAKKMAQNIIAIGKNLDMEIVAEGVEAPEQVEILSSFGCNRFQGYHFAKPLPIDNLYELIKHNDVYYAMPALG